MRESFLRGLRHQTEASQGSNPLHRQYTNITVLTIRGSLQDRLIQSATPSTSAPSFAQFSSVLLTSLLLL
jgi:hypothetical protein